MQIEAILAGIGLVFLGIIGTAFIMVRLMARSMAMIAVKHISIIQAVVDSSYLASLEGHKTIETYTGAVNRIASEKFGVQLKLMVMTRR